MLDVVKLGDLGLAIIVNKTMNKFSSFGTSAYNGPELMDDDLRSLNSKSDIW